MSWSKMGRHALQVRDRGVATVEYALLIGLVALPLVGVLTGLTGHLTTFFQSALDTVTHRPETPIVAPPEDGQGAGGRMVLTYDTTKSSLYCGKTIVLPTHGGVSGTVDWGDGTTEALSPFVSHTYAANGEYTVTVDGTFTAFGQGGVMTKDGAACLTSVDEWQDTGTLTAHRAFQHAEHLTSVAAPPTTITDMSWMFYNAKRFDQDLTHWDVSGVQDMSAMFHSALAFNGDLGNWDVSGVETMSGMFTSAQSFNRDISGWQIRGPVMAGMFLGAQSFNQDISGWDMSRVENISGMFQGASSFNQPLDAWDTSRVTSMKSTFSRAHAFSQDLAGWDTSSVTDMSWMFQEATAFNGNIDTWDTSSVTDMSRMFDGATTFNRDISGWDVSGVTAMHSMFSGATSFRQDLSDWEASHLSRPTDFDRNSGWPSYLQPQFK